MYTYMLIRVSNIKLSLDEYTHTHGENQNQLTQDCNPCVVNYGEYVLPSQITKQKV